ncbi:MAG: hypothetical protein CM15mP68_4840 [Pseudomonadota bacterium]|nr:MAG: hypothetical protein CM15mP68_4840 [Pseudomonadota bacterium]
MTYLPYAGDLTQACIPLGFFTAFCLQHHLLNPEVEQVHADLVTQCRYQEGPVSALFVALVRSSRAHLSPKGQGLRQCCLGTESVFARSLVKTVGE